MNRKHYKTSRNSVCVIAGRVSLLLERRMKGLAECKKRYAQAPQVLLVAHAIVQKYREGPRHDGGRQSRPQPAHCRSLLKEGAPKTVVLLTSGCDRGPVSGLKNASANTGHRGTCQVLAKEVGVINERRRRRRGVGGVFPETLLAVNAFLFQPKQQPAECILW